MIAQNLEGLNCVQRVSGPVKTGVLVGGFQALHGAFWLSSVSELSSSFCKNMCILTGEQIAALFSMLLVTASFYHELVLV